MGSNIILTYPGGRVGGCTVSRDLPPSVQLGEVIRWLLHFSHRHLGNPGQATDLDLQVQVGHG